MAVRISRGYDADTKPAYNEISEGVRPVYSDVPIPPYFNLPIFDMDKLHDDPIVLPAGVLIGVKRDELATEGEGQLVPAVASLSGDLGSRAGGIVTVGSTHTSDETDWGVSTSGWYAPVAPLGVTFKPIYMFPPDPNDSNDTRTSYENYKREHKVPIVTDYVIEVPCRTPLEHAIRPGDTVMVSNYKHWNNEQTQGTYTRGACGTFMAVADALTSDSGVTGALTTVGNGVARIHDFVVGKCLQTVIIGTDSNAQAGDFLWNALANGRFTKATTASVGSTDASQKDATTIWKNLELVQTVPGHRVSGSGTKGVPGFLAGTFGARSDGSGVYRMLRILLRV